MHVGTPLATVPVSFFDHRTGLSALAIQHLRCDGRVVLVYHDAPGAASTRRLLSGVAETLAGELAEGHTLGLIESSVPEHRAEPFIYARVTLSAAIHPGHVDAGDGRVIGVETVARECGIEVAEVRRTEQLVIVIHKPRACAFAGFRQLALGERAGGVLAAA
jgi:hypothetical protein